MLKGWKSSLRCECSQFELQPSRHKLQDKIIVGGIYVRIYTEYASCSLICDAKDYIIYFFLLFHYKHMNAMWQVYSRVTSTKKCQLILFKFLKVSGGGANSEVGFIALELFT